MAAKSEKSGRKDLVIVESPAKAKTINRYLGDGYVVKASMGHVRDLPSKGMGVDLETFEPQYELLPSRGKVIAELKKLARQSDRVYLATDLDREGEAIAWHLKEALGVDDTRAQRVIFNAITRSEIQKAFSRPHAIDIDRVNAQQARRILDRIVGYEISPLLWRKVARGLSAGRVQSVAVRLVVQREREIEAFDPQEYWKIAAVLTTRGDRTTALAAEYAALTAGPENGATAAERNAWLAGHDAFVAELAELGGKPFKPSGPDEALAAAKLLGFVLADRKEVVDDGAKGAARRVVTLAGRMGTAPAYTVRSVEEKDSSSRPPAPFITSTLQQAASSRLSFGAQRAMRIAQSLYEAGHITYMRTDSTHLSDDAVRMARGHIEKAFGARYLPEKANVYSSSNKQAQEAHEAIRPTEASLTPAEARRTLSPDEYRLYQLIWNRFIACQMAAALFKNTTAMIDLQAPGGAVLKASGRKLVFDGFLRVAGMSSDEALLPALAAGQRVYPLDVAPSQHFTQPPARYTEATLVKEMEKLGIGRPSTYASITQTIVDRKYVELIERRFHATLLGMIVTDKLVQGFPEIMDVQFTAEMETKLDRIEEQHLDWIKLLKDFYGPFHQSVDAALEKLDHAGGTSSPYTCPKCSSPMVYRISKNGFFLACTNRDACSATQPVDAQGKPTVREVSSVRCPVCGREMIKRRGRFGEFLGCSGYAQKKDDGTPECATIINLDKEGQPLPPKPAPIATPVKCEKCGAGMLLRDSKRGPFLGCSSFPKCRSTRIVTKLPDDQRALVEQLIPLLKEEASKARELVAKLTGVTAPAAPTGPIATDIDCDECGKPMVIRKGRRGPFLGCSGYPKCRNTAEVPAKLLEEMGLGEERREEAGKAEASGGE